MSVECKGDRVNKIQTFQSISRPYEPGVTSASEIRGHALQKKERRPVPEIPSVVCSLLLQGNGSP